MQRPPQPVEPPNRQHIAGARHLQRHGEPRPRRLRAADPVLVDFLAADQPQRITLQVEVLVIGRDPRVADQHAAPDGQGTRAEKMFLTVDTLTGFYARYSGLPSHLWHDPSAGQQTGRLSARPSPPPVAISVGTTPMIAIPVAAFMRPVAMIVGPTPQVRCNDSGHARPMIAIRAADDCGSLHLLTLLSRKLPRRHGSFLLPRRGCGLVAVEIPTWGERGRGSSRWERHARTLSNVCG